MKTLLQLERDYKLSQKKHRRENFYFRLLFELPELLIEESPLVRNQLISIFTIILSILNKNVLSLNRRKKIDVERVHLVTNILNWIEDTYTKSHNTTF